MLTTEHKEPIKIPGLADSEGWGDADKEGSGDGEAVAPVGHKRVAYSHTNWWAMYVFTSTELMGGKLNNN